MDVTLHIRLTTKELVEKVEQMREQGYLIPVLVRNFLSDFPLEKKKEKSSLDC